MLLEVRSQRNSSIKAVQVETSIERAKDHVIMLRCSSDVMFKGFIAFEYSEPVDYFDVDFNRLESELSEYMLVANVKNHSGSSIANNNELIAQYTTFKYS